MLEPGDRVPDFATLDHDRRPFLLGEHAAGRPFTLVWGGPEVIGSAERRAAQGETVLAVVAAAPHELPAPMAATLRLVADDGRLAALFGPPTGTLAIDANLRVTTPGAGHERRPAPLLFVPRVLPAELCAELVARFPHERPERSGRRTVVDGVETLVPDPEMKERLDWRVRDPDLEALLTNLLGRRLLPETERAFGHRCTGLEHHKVVAYPAGAGWFRPHRDTTAPGTEHRRYAVTVNLDRGYAGGGLRFPEYGPDVVHPDVGEAVVFSGALLHEVTEVTAGCRHALVNFVW